MSNLYCHPGRAGGSLADARNRCVTLDFSCKSGALLPKFATEAAYEASQPGPAGSGDNVIGKSQAQPAWHGE
jgi:hypothetical protein